LFNLSTDYDISRRGGQTGTSADVQTDYGRNCLSVTNGDSRGRQIKREAAFGRQACRKRGDFGTSGTKFILQFVQRPAKVLIVEGCREPGFRTPVSKVVGLALGVDSVGERPQRLYGAVELGDLGAAVVLPGSARKSSTACWMWDV